MMNQSMIKSKSMMILERLQRKRYYYATGCLLYYQYFKDHYQFIAVDLSKQKELDADLRAIQQIECYGMLNTNSQVGTVLEKSKETILEFHKVTAKMNKWLNTTHKC